MKNRIKIGDYNEIIIYREEKEMYFHGAKRTSTYVSTRTALTDNCTWLMVYGNLSKRHYKEVREIAVKDRLMYGELLNYHNSRRYASKSDYKY